MVFEAARTGDAVARRILLRAGAELALGALTCIRVLGMERDELDVVASGGVLTTDDYVLPRLGLLLSRRCPGARLVRPRYEPAVGAALVALRKAGVALDDAAYSRLDASLERSRAIPESGDPQRSRPE